MKKRYEVIRTVAPATYMGRYTTEVEAESVAMRSYQTYGIPCVIWDDTLKEYVDLHQSIDVSALSTVYCCVCGRPAQMLPYSSNQVRCSEGHNVEVRSAAQLRPTAPPPVAGAVGGPASFAPPVATPTTVTPQVVSNGRREFL